MSKEWCPICEEGRLTRMIDTNRVEHKGIVKMVPIYYSSCNYCGMEQGDEQETLRNKECMQEFVKEVDKYFAGFGEIR